MRSYIFEWLGPSLDPRLPPAMSPSSETAVPPGGRRIVLLETLWALPVAVMTGSASALFLWSLDRVTQLRFAFPWLLFGLPLAGAAMIWAYRRFGDNADQGTNLILKQVHEPSGAVPARLAPFILLSTLLTHLCGGSAGREGTAVQMGGGIAGGLVRWCRIPRASEAHVLLAGMAAGFGAVFGTPLAGAIFALEVSIIGRLRIAAVVPCLLAGFVGDATCTAWGIHHTHYEISSSFLLPTTAAQSVPAWQFHTLLSIKILLAAICFGLASRLFVEAMHFLGMQSHRWLTQPLWRPVVGGLIVIGLTFLIEDRSYLGLGVSSPVAGEVSILSSFHAGGAHPWSWAWKLLFTAVTLSAGFKGGEVTPLFFVGAALGNTLGGWFNAPIDLFAGLGFVAVFAAASNTPLTCAIMGMELFGKEHGLYLGLACFVAYLASGHAGIYSAQRLGRGKRLYSNHPPEATLGEWRSAKK